MRGSQGKAQVTRALKHLKSGKEPFFLRAYILEPDYAYAPPQRARKFGSKQLDLDDGEIWEADKQIDRLLKALKQRQLWDDTIVVVSGDHGEEFREHGKRFHSSNLYEPQVRTALVVRVPGVAAQRIDAAASLTDLPPTMLNLLGLRAEFDQTNSRNLTPALFGWALARTWFVSELFQNLRFSKYQASLIDGSYQLLYNGSSGQFRLFDVARDPTEKTPIDNQDPSFKELKEKRLLFLEHHAKRPPTE